MTMVPGECWYLNFDCRIGCRSWGRPRAEALTTDRAADPGLLADGANPAAMAQLDLAGGSPSQFRAMIYCTALQGIFPSRNRLIS
jgi:hypothetical protein